MTIQTSGKFVSLTGNAYERGMQQAAACPEMVPNVRRAIYERLEAVGDLLKRPRLCTLLADMIACAEAHAPMSVAETRGIADGFSIPQDTLFEFLHLPVLLDVSQSEKGHDDGCSVWAAPDTEGHVWLAKNRDYGGNHRAIQRVFHHQGDGLAAGPMLCVGSLGAPGAFSSGMNAHGLALADTQVATRDHGPGLSRYFLMSELLGRCRSLSEALAYLKSVRHAGGGCLVIGDESGRVAAVELGWRDQVIDLAEESRWVARTNHHLASPLAERLIEPAASEAGNNTRGRHANLTAAVGTAVPLAEPKGFFSRLMGSHDEDVPSGQLGLYCHGKDGGARTISSVLFDIHARRLYFCDGSPCSGPGITYTL